MPLLELLDQHGFGLAAFALCQQLADADDRGEPGFERRLGPLQHRLVGLAEILAALAVADDDVAARPRRSASGRRFRP